jgi:hypothetical protein
METRSKILKKYDAHTMSCIQAAYEDLHLMIEEIFIYVKEIPNQLSFKEFTLLFEKYDWQDIIFIIEYIDSIFNLRNQKSVYELMNKLISEEKSIYPIETITDNSYISENS